MNKNNYAKISDLIFGNALEGNRGITALGQSVLNQISEWVCYDILIDYASQGAVIELITQSYLIGKVGTIKFLHALDTEGDRIVAEQSV